MGPCGMARGEVCRLTVHHRRDRKTGPCFPLTVMWCREHRRGFTLYPPGHVPYGRLALAPVNFDDGPVCDEDGAAAWSSTLFGAALDAEKAECWNRDDGSDNYTGGGSDRWWSTQSRHLAHLARLVGVDPLLDPLRQQRLSEVLVIALLLLVEQAKRITRCGGYRSRGRAVCAVLDALPKIRRLGDRLAAAGWISGLWGQPYRWEHETGSLRALYPHFGTRDPPPP